MIIPLDTAKDKLAELLKINKLIIFVGAGISVVSGLPTWDGFLEKFIVFCENIPKEYPRVAKLQEVFNPSLIQSSHSERLQNPVHVATVMKSEIKKLPESIRKDIEDDFKRWFYDLFNDAEPNNNHKLIVETKFPYILTSNYDLLIEDASKESKIGLPSASFYEKERIAESIYQNHPLIIHVHGKFTDVIFDKIIFTSEDYAQIIKKAYPGFSFALQSLFLNHSALFVGYGASDPHLEDLIQEFSYWFDFNSDRNISRNYLVTKTERANIIVEKYKDKLRTDLITIDDYSCYDDLLNHLKVSCPNTPT